MLVVYIVSSIVFLIIFGIVNMTRKEGFYKHAVLKGISDSKKKLIKGITNNKLLNTIVIGSRSNYTLEELDHRNPQGYYNDKSMSVYDKSLLHQHSKRFDPKMTT
jgi:hypothetical protein